MYYFNLYLFPAFIILYSSLKEWAVAEEKGTAKRSIAILVISFLLILLMNTTSFYSFFHKSYALFNMIPIIIMVISLLVGFGSKKSARISMLRLSCVVVGILYFSSISIFSLSFQNKRELEKINYENAHEITKHFVANNREIGPVLYLDDGLGLALLGCESYSRYFFPVPIQRVDLENGEGNEDFQSELRRDIAYDGQYIFINEDWFYRYYKNLAIKNKIESEYQLVYTYTLFVDTSFTFCNNDAVVPVEYKLLKRM